MHPFFFGTVWSAVATAPALYSTPYVGGSLIFLVKDRGDPAAPNILTTEGRAPDHARGFSRREIIKQGAEP
jgi:hypothetical protein